MYNFGVITDGISMDLEDAFKVLVEAGLRHAELQFLWGKEAGDQTAEEIRRIKQLKESYGMQISCISRHVFAGLPVMTTSAGDEQYRRHLVGLKSCIQMAKELECRLVRIMSFRKEMIIFGFNGAEQWVASSGSWEKLLALMEPPVRLAEREGITLVVETGNNAMINSGALAKRLVEDLGSRHLRILWDIPNTLYSAEIPYPDAYKEIRDYLGHVHIKDCRVNIARATVRFCALGEGHMAPYLDGIFSSLRKDGYSGSISYESVYRPEGGTFADGFRESLPTLKKYAP
jgi:sugar phosphate isomerase/epimerase